jgi:hypothetical protein
VCGYLALLRKADGHSVRIWCSDVSHVVLARHEVHAQSVKNSCATHVSMVCVVVSFGIVLEHYVAFEGLTWSQRRTFLWALYIVSFSVINFCFWRDSPPPSPSGPGPPHSRGFFSVQKKYSTVFHPPATS